MGFVPHVPARVSEDAEKHEFLDTVPDPPKVKYLNLGMEEVGKELVGMKSRQGIRIMFVSYIVGVHRFSLCLVVHSFGT